MSFSRIAEMTRVPIRLNNNKRPSLAAFCFCVLITSCTQEEFLKTDPNLASYPFDDYVCADFTVEATEASFDQPLPIAEQDMSNGAHPIAGVVSHHALASDWINAFFNDLSAKRDIDTFIILSPRHYSQGDSYISLSPLPWQVGDTVVEVEKRYYEQFSHQLGLNADPWAFSGEHGIETLLPYIAHYFPDAKIMPILQKEKPLRLDLLSSLSDVVAEVIEREPGAFLLISSDFSHHEGVEITRTRDAKSRVFLEVLCDASLGIVGCDNIGSMFVLQDVLQSENQIRTVIRNHTDSLKISGEQELDITSYFFSYFTVPEHDSHDELFDAVRRSVREGLSGAKNVGFEDYIYSDANSGIAVRFRSGDTERGCIAYYKGISDFTSAAASAAKNAAFFDGRYPTIQRDELKDLTIEISLIGAGFKMTDPLNFIPGHHSLLITGPGGQAFLQASVAEQKDMNRKDFLRAVSLKAGLDADSWQESDFDLIRFPTEYFSEKF